MTHDIFLDGAKLNTYMKGRISGIIYVLTGMPEKGYPWCNTGDNDIWSTAFDCTDEQYETIIKTIEKLYPGAIVMKV